MPNNQYVFFLLFQNSQTADQAATAFSEAGYQHKDLGFFATEDVINHMKTQKDTNIVADKVSSDAASGAIVGGLLGLIGGATALALPIVGPIFATGPIAAALGYGAAGAASGAVTGGVDKEVAENIQAIIQQGGVLVTAYAHDKDEIHQILGDIQPLKLIQSDISREV